MTRPRKKRRTWRTLDKFSLDEISSVGRPAQEGALATIAKGAPLDDAEFAEWLEQIGDDLDVGKTGDTSGVDGLDSDTEDEDEDQPAPRARRRTRKGGDLVQLVTGSTEGHQHGVRAYASEHEGLVLTVSYAQREGAESSHDHMVVANADGTYIVTENDGHAHELDTERVRQVVFDMLAKGASNVEQIQQRAEFLGVEKMLPGGDALAALVGRGIEHASNENGLSKEQEPMDPKELAKALERIEAGNKETRELALMSDVEKAHYLTLTGDEASAYLAKSSTERVEIAKALDDTTTEPETVEKGEDPVVYTTLSGHAIRKSDGATALTLAKEADEDKKARALEKAASDRLRIEKRAKDEFGDLPGETATHVAIIKALEGIKDEPTRTAAFAVLKAKAPAFTQATGPVGVVGSPEEIAKGNHRAHATAELDRLAKAYVADSGNDVSDYFDAYDVVASANPQLLEAAVG